MAARIWLGHLWRGLTAQEEGRGEAYPEGHQDGLGFPNCFTVGGSTQASSSGKGQARSEVELLVPAWICPGETPALCQWTQEWLGWPEMLFSAHQALLGTQLDKRNY